MSEIRVMPLPKVTGIWRHDFSKCPDEVMIPMSNGRIVKYVIDVKQPGPVFREPLDKFSRLCKGEVTK